MSTKTKLPVRLRIKPGCSIDGIREGKRLKEGLYVLGKNLSGEERDLLIDPQFQHAVEILNDTPEPEGLAEDRDLPKGEQGIEYLRKKRADAEGEYQKRWPAGRPSQTSII